MRNALLILLVLAAVGDGVVLAQPPKGAVGGTLTIGVLAQSNPLAKDFEASNVSCSWSKKDHVVVHVSAKNTSSEHVTAHIKPRYCIAGHGEYGNGVTSVKEAGFDAGELRNLWMDVGHPKGVPAKTPIARCAPYLWYLEPE